MRLMCKYCTAMARVKDHQLVPKGGYQFREDGVEFSANTIGVLMRQVYAYRLANKKLLQTKSQLQAEIEEAVCKERPQLCVEDDGQLTVIKMAANFAMALIRWGKAGFPLVSETTFDQRKKTCLECPHIRGWKDAGMTACSLCGCVNGSVSVKLWLATERCPDKPPRWNEVTN